MFAEDEALLLIEPHPAPELEALVADAWRASLWSTCSAGSSSTVGGAVEPGVFVPRRRTELMVREARRARNASGRTARRRPLLRLRRGGGGRSPSARRGRLLAADVDPAAVRCAARNVTPLGATCCSATSSTPLPTDVRGRIDVLTANVPYVPTEAIA